MRQLLIELIAAGAFLAALALVVKRTKDRRSLPMAIAVLAFVFLCLGVILTTAVQTMGNQDVLYLLLAVLAFIMLAAMLWFLLSNSRELNHIAFSVFLIYLAVLLFATIFSRSDVHNTTIQLNTLDSLPLAMRTHTIEPMRHMLDNMLLFVPLGILLPAMHKKLDSWLYALLNGAMLSTAIETTQLLASIGICDVDDILANTVGSMLGYLLYKLLAPYIRKGKGKKKR